MKQRVKHVSYLAKSVIDLHTLKASEAMDLFALPQGAEIIHFDIEVLESGDTGAQIDIGLNESGDFFANDVDVATTGYYKVARGTTTKAKSVATITLSQASTKGQVSIRVVYFLPSEYVYEI